MINERAPAPAGANVGSPSAVPGGPAQARAQQKQAPATAVALEAPALVTRVPVSAGAKKLWRQAGPGSARAPGCGWITGERAGGSR